MRRAHVSEVGFSFIYRGTSEITDLRRIGRGAFLLRAKPLKLFARRADANKTGGAGFAQSLEFTISL